MTYSKNPAVLRVLEKIAGSGMPGFRIPSGMSSGAVQDALRGARTPVYRSPEFLAAVAGSTAPFILEKGYAAVQKVLQGRQKAHAFREAVQQNPALKKFDSTLSQRYFNTLWRTNPEMAKDPTIASTFIIQNHEGHDLDRPGHHQHLMASVEQVANIRRHLSQSRPAGAGFRGVSDPTKALVGNLARDYDYLRKQEAITQAHGAAHPMAPRS